MEVINARVMKDLKVMAKKCVKRREFDKIYFCSVFIFLSIFLLLFLIFLRCWPKCDHGTCNMTTYQCKCDLGWKGDNCSIDCGCNGHSTCVNQTGVCDKCQGIQVV